MKLKKLKEWWRQKVKKSQKDDINTSVSGSVDIDLNETNAFEESATQSLLDTLMQKIMDTQMFEDELRDLGSKPITMLLPIGEKKTFFLFSPVLQTYRSVNAPIEAKVVEESNGRETLCIINNIMFLVPDDYLVNVGYN
jgi:hypothetical protein